MQEILVNLENDYPSKTPLRSNAGIVLEYGMLDGTRPFFFSPSSPVFF